MQGVSSLKQFAEELRQLWQHLILPALAVILPWRWWIFLVYRNSGDLSKAGRTELATAVHFHPRHYAQRYAHELVDRADFFLYKAGRRPAIKFSGTDINTISGAAIFFTFHYGQGFWALDHLNQHGQSISWLHAPVAQKPPLGEKVSSWIGRRRIELVAAISGSDTIATGGSVEKMMAQLHHNGHSIMIMPDAPIRPGQSTIAVRFLGQKARFAAGAITMAASSGFPIYIYTMSADLNTGVREMYTAGPLQNLNAEELAQALADILSEGIRNKPAAWHVWPFINHFIPDHE